MSAFYISKDGGVSGPFVASQIVAMWDAGKLTGGDSVSEEKDGGWSPLRDHIVKIQETAGKRPDASGKGQFVTNGLMVLVVLFVLFLLFLLWMKATAPVWGPATP